MDAEEADRLELSLDLLESLSHDPELAEWNGLGFVIQAYGKRCPHVIDFVVDLAQRSRRRIMVRLVKGAYWDSDTVRYRQAGWPVPLFEQKADTDANYEALIPLLLRHRAVIRPAFGTHNLRSLAVIEAAAE